jgi:hypothetical protein
MVSLSEATRAAVMVQPRPQQGWYGWYEAVRGPLGPYRVSLGARTREVIRVIPYHPAVFLGRVAIRAAPCCR